MGVLGEEGWQKVALVFISLLINAWEKYHCYNSWTTYCYQKLHFKSYINALFNIFHFIKILICLLNLNIYTTFKKVSWKWHRIRYLVDLSWYFGSIFIGGKTYAKYLTFLSKNFLIWKEKKIVMTLGLG